LSSVAVVGTTTWGTTLAIILARKKLSVTLLARSRQEAADLESARCNARFVPGVEFPSSLHVAHDPAAAMDGASIVILAVPSATLRDNVVWVRDALRDDPVVLSASKGLDVNTGKRMSQVLQEELPQRLHRRISVLSGPNLALEIVKGRPASTVVASPQQDAACQAQEMLMSPTFRVYTNGDTIGVELGGALKNIIAIGAGICDGLGYGDNGKAAFMTRGLAEITRLGVAAGASPSTFYGLAGLGDLVATCASPLSRNHRVGQELALGRSLDEIQASMNNVAEGVHTTAAAVRMAERLGVEMPIANATYKVLFGGLDPRQAVVELMGRPPRAEGEGMA
jgi:glycerol-3-phosphate dehydrogenase (NAD(P)+)